MTILASITTAQAMTGLYIGIGAGYAKIRNTPKPVTKQAQYGFHTKLGYTYDINKKIGLGLEK